MNSEHINVSFVVDLPYKQIDFAAIFALKFSAYAH